jgi:hypothetical protein
VLLARPHLDLAQASPDAVERRRWIARQGHP